MSSLSVNKLVKDLLTKNLSVLQTKVLVITTQYKTNLYNKEASLKILLVKQEMLERYKNKASSMLLQKAHEKYLQEEMKTI